MSSKAFGKFVLRRRIGSGGMAEVFEADLTGSQGFSRRVALKRMHASCREDQSFVDMFIDEAHIASRFDHPNVLRVYEFGEIDQQYYLAMEFVDGCDLSTVLRRLAAAGRSLSEGAVRYIATRLLRGLSCIHEDGSGVVHRDVSPQNVFISRRGEVKLGDFGIATSAQRRAETKAGQLKGKLSYLAPEQATGETVSAQTDLYSAGLVIYEMCTGEKRIDGITDADVLRVAMDPPEFAPDPRIARDIASVLQNALEVVPAMRYTNASTMCTALERGQAHFGADQLAAELGELLEPASQGEPLDASPTETPTAKPADETPTHIDGPRANRWPLVGGVILLIALPTIGYWAGKKDDTPAVDRRTANQLNAPLPTPRDATAVDSVVAAQRPDAGATIAAAKPDASGRRSKRRPKTKQKRRRPQRPIVTQKPPNTANDAQQLAALRKRLTSILSKAKTRGIFPGDDAKLDRKASAARAAIKAGSLTSASATLDELARLEASIAVNRAFADRKLARLNRRIKRHKPAGERLKQIRKRLHHILQLIVSEKYGTASSAMSRAMIQLRKSSDR